MTEQQVHEMGMEAARTDKNNNPPVEVVRSGMEAVWHEGYNLFHDQADELMGQL